MECVHATGGVLVHARVQVAALDTGVAQEQRTNANGYYRFPGLSVGRYTVTVISDGFKTMVITDVILQVGQTRTLDARLNVGATTETLEVAASTDPAERTSPAASTIVITALGGAAVGLEREWSGHASGPEAHFAGIRTFTLLGGLAGVTGWFWILNLCAPAVCFLAERQVW